MRSIEWPGGVEDAVEELRRLCDERDESRSELWQALYEGSLAHGVDSIDVNLACQVFLLGWVVLTGEGRHEDAIAALDMLFSHCQFQTLGFGGYLMWIRAFESLMYLRQWEEAAEGFLALLPPTSGWDRSIGIGIILAIIRCFSKRRGLRKIPPELRAVIQSVARSAGFPEMPESEMNVRGLIDLWKHL